MTDIVVSLSVVCNNPADAAEAAARMAPLQSYLIANRVGTGVAVSAYDADDDETADPDDLIKP
jgi:hypothetical protein